MMVYEKAPLQWQKGREVLRVEEITIWAILGSGGWILNQLRVAMNHAGSHSRPARGQRFKSSIKSETRGDSIQAMATAAPAQGVRATAALATSDQVLLASGR